MGSSVRNGSKNLSKVVSMIPVELWRIVVIFIAVSARIQAYSAPYFHWVGVMLGSPSHTKNLLMPHILLEGGIFRVNAGVYILKDV